MTEIKETDQQQSPNGWLLYDGDCSFCTALARRFAGFVNRRGFAVLPLQTPWVEGELGLDPKEPLREMVLLTRDRHRYGGADALLQLAHESVATRPFATLGRIGIVHGLLELAYRWIAERRACLGTCKIAPKDHEFLIR